MQRISLLLFENRANLAKLDVLKSYYLVFESILRDSIDISLRLRLVKVEEVAYIIHWLSSNSSGSDTASSWLFLRLERGGGAI